MKIDVDLEEDVGMEVIDMAKRVCLVIKTPDGSTDMNLHMTREKFDYFLEELEHYKKYR